MTRHVGAAIFICILLTGAMVQAQERMAIQSNVANIRSGPGTDEAVIWQAEQYYPVIILEKKGEWRRFQDFEGDQGWVHVSLLSTIKTVVTKADNCNIRKGPGTQYDVAFRVSKGIPFKVLETKGSWLKIEHADGDIGWIAKSLIW